MHRRKVFGRLWRAFQAVSTTEQEDQRRPLLGTSPWSICHRNGVASGAGTVALRAGRRSKRLPSRRSVERMCINRLPNIRALNCAQESR